LKVIWESAEGANKHIAHPLRVLTKYPFDYNTAICVNKKVLFLVSSSKMHVAYLCLMQHTLGFNLVQLLDQFWVPDIWEIQGAHTALAKLHRRCSTSQWRVLAEQEQPELQRALLAASELTLEALTTHFCKAEGKKKPPLLSALWTDKLVRPVMERYIYRKMEVFWSNAHAAQALISLNAAHRPILGHHTLQWAENEAHGLLHLERTSDTLRYRLEVTYQENTCAFANLTVLAHGTPAWFVLDRQIVRLPCISGKMLVPFQTKDVLEISRVHEATWFRQFLKKNLDGAADVQAEGFALQQVNAMQYAHLQPVRHLFTGEWLLSVDFHYDHQVSFHPGEKTAVRSLIIIPDDPQGEVTVIRVERDTMSEAKCQNALVSFGLTRNEKNYELTGATDLATIVSWLHSNREAIEHAGFQFDLQHPETGTALSTETPELEVNTTSDRDWFDARIWVRVGVQRIPFRAFVGHIRQRRAEFMLPNGTMFLIPDAWFTRFAELAQLSDSQTDEAYQSADPEVIRIGKLQTEVLQSLEIQVTTQPIPAPPTIDIATHIDLSASWSQNDLLKADLRPYQRIGIDWMLNLLHGGYGACLADDMGLGKTLQTIAVLTYLKAAQKQLPNNKELVPADTEASQYAQLDLFAAPIRAHLPLQALVVVPASLVFNWQAELRRFAPDLFVYAHTGTRRITDRRAIAAHDVVLTTYHTCREDITLLKAIDWQCIVLDEAQNIKNRSAELTKAVNQLSAAHKLALSGTPVENSLADLWSLMHFLNPSLLGSYASFSKMFQQPIERERNAEVQNRLTERVRPFMLRRRKHEVAPDLPPLSRQVHLVPMTDAQAELYEKTKSAARNSLLQIGQDAEFRFAALQALMRLRQLACHPALLPDMPDTGIAFGKFDSVFQVWQSVVDQGSKVLIFSSFEQHLRIYEQHFQAQNLPYAWISGSTPTDYRRREVERFQTEPEVSTFFITLKAGGTGLNLTAADYVFLIDPWWNPQAEEQAFARAHRIGQERPVHAIRFITQGTIEEKIMLLQAEKYALGADLMDDEMPTGMSTEDVRALFK
jgi:superfamily II DNA or RNA helicase